MSKQTFLLILVLALGAFFRFYQITEIPPGLYPDEAMNGNNALEALASGHFKVFYPENNGREGLFINLQAVSLKLFGNEPWALRIVSALFGTLTILGVYLVAKELLRNQAVALLSSFFLAASYWHINFSRIGFRAIMVPFLTTFALYFFVKGLRRGKILDMVWAGIFTGLGFYTYIAFRFFPFVLAAPLLWYLWGWWKKKTSICTPCAVSLFALVALAIITPMALYFVQNPHDFFGRAGDVAIFSARSPSTEFLKSNLATIGMFFVRGDCNWRHNFDCQPQLNPLVALFFVVGIAVLMRNATSYKLQATSLFAWLLFLSLPATLTREGLPHALRSIGMIPPVMILSGFGAWWIYQKTQEWLESKKNKWSTHAGQLERIKKEVLLLSLLVSLLIPIMTYRNYFARWASNENTYFSFSADVWHLGQYLNSLPLDTKKYVVVNLPGVDVRGIPMPAQTVMFATDSFRETERRRKNIEYVLPQNTDKIILRAEQGGVEKFSTSPVRNEISNGASSNSKVIIAFLNGEDRNPIFDIQKKFSDFKIRVPGDFVILEN